MSAGSLPLSDQQHLSEPTGESGEENQSVQESRSRTQQESQAGRRKTWPERRRERREVKKLRREAQARRGGAGLLGRSQNFEDEVCPTAPFRSTQDSHKPSPPPAKKKRKDEEDVGRSKKSREAERWKKRGGKKRGDLYCDSDIVRGKRLSLKKKVRHRERYFKL